MNYRDAIASIESSGSGGYSAVGPRTKTGDRAYGRYQVMGANIPEWTRAVFGRAMSPQEFLANPEAQDRVFKHRFGGYVQKYGNPADAASAWFTGRPRSASSGQARDALGTSGNQYVAKFAAALGGQQAPMAYAPQPASPSAFDGFSAPQPQSEPGPLYGVSGGVRMGPLWDAAPTASGGSKYDYSIAPDGKSVSWRNAMGKLLTAQR